MCKYLICALFLLTMIPAQADFIKYTGLGPNYRGYQPKLSSNQIPSTNYRRALSSRDLRALEKYAMNKSYPGENDIQRLERLENLAFGSTQVGDIYSRYQNVENAILSRPQYNHRRSVLGNIANYFIGQSTGFTPAITPYNDWGNNMNIYPQFPSSGFGNSTFHQHSNGIFGGGWGMSGNNFNSGSSIRILD